MSCTRPWNPPTHRYGSATATETGYRKLHRPPSGPAGGGTHQASFSQINGYPASSQRAGHSTKCRCSIRRSFRGQRSTAAFLVRAGLLVVWLSLDVAGSRSVLAHGWHEPRCGFLEQVGSHAWPLPHQTRPHHPSARPRVARAPVPTLLRSSSPKSPERCAYLCQTSQMVYHPNFGLQ